jgi:hypothetical protein
VQVFFFFPHDRLGRLSYTHVVRKRVRTYMASYCVYIILLLLLLFNALNGNGCIMYSNALKEYYDIIIIYENVRHSPKTAQSRV